MLDTQVADKLATAVGSRFREMLDEAFALGKLDALALSDKKNEKWMVFEVFWRLVRDWSSILDSIPAITDTEREEWDWHLELNYPSSQESENPKYRFDIGYGPAVRNNYVYFATHDTVVFQAKMIRGFKLFESHQSVRYDVDRIREERMRHGYIMVLWMIYPEFLGPKLGYAWEDDEHMRDRAEELTGAFAAALPELIPISPKWGPFRLTLIENWGAECDHCVFARLFRVVPSEAPTL